jgi:hypothetical protein
MRGKLLLNPLLGCSFERAEEGSWHYEEVRFRYRDRLSSRRSISLTPGPVRQP